MRTIIIAVGEELVVVLDRRLLGELGLEAGSEVEVSRAGDGLALAPVADREARIRALSLEVMREHEETFRKLAK
jgi:antitoxin component of MazEF toxin-antitoxin module